MARTLSSCNGSTLPGQSDEKLFDQQVEALEEEEGEEKEGKRAPSCHPKEEKEISEERRVNYLSSGC